MGYYSTVTGQLVIKPGLLTADLGDLADEAADDYDLIAKNEGTEGTLALDGNGKIVVVPGTFKTVVECRFEDDFKAYTLTQSVQAVVNLAKSKDAKVNGILYVYGEENADIWRIRVEDNVVYEEKPTLVWPNGDKDGL